MSLSDNVVHQTSFKATMGNSHWKPNIVDDGQFDIICIVILCVMSSNYKLISALRSSNGDAIKDGGMGRQVT